MNNFEEDLRFARMEGFDVFVSETYCKACSGDVYRTEDGRCVSCFKEKKEVVSNKPKRKLVRKDEETKRKDDEYKIYVIKSFFDYNPDTGVIKWKENVDEGFYKIKFYHKKFMEEKAGRVVKFTVVKDKRHDSIRGLQIGILAINCRAHQIAWVLTQGKLPDHEIDHIDGNPCNNTIGNLRDVERKINQRNRKRRSDNNSGITGVSWTPSHNKWRATVVDDVGNIIFIGQFKNKTKAVNARKEWMESNKHLGYTERHLGF